MLLNESLFIVLCFIVSSVDLSGPFREVAHQSEHQHISQISTMSEAMWIIIFLYRTFMSLYKGLNIMTFKDGNYN